MVIRVPDWRTLIADGVAARGADRPPRRSLAINYPDGGPLAAAIFRACRKRNMSLTAYMRRALVAFVCYDLGEDWHKLMADEPKFRTFGERRDVPVEGKGRGFGPWRIMVVEDYDDEHR